MLDMFVTARIARDLTQRQFAAAPRRTARIAEPEATAPRAPVRRGTVRVLRRVADRLEPAPRCAPQA
jgi:hypothetical protein